MSNASNMVPSTYSFCRRCSARVELGRVAFGDKITCHACGFEFAISRPSKNSDDAEQGRGDAYHVDPQVAGGGSPAKLFLSGTFAFPFQIATLWQTLTLCAATVALVGAFRLGAWCITADSEGVDKFTRVLLSNGLLFSLAFGSLVLAGWIYAASAFGVTILRETAWGVDVIEDWPNLLALDGVSEVPHVAASLLLAVLPGVTAIPLWNRLGVPPLWSVVAIVILLFPPLLLAILDSDPSAAGRSLLRAWPAWLGFHIVTCGTAAVAVVFQIILQRHTLWAVEVPVTGVVIAVGWMIYFRLLGRLASFCPVRPQEGCAATASQEPLATRDSQWR